MRRPWYNGGSTQQETERTDMTAYDACAARLPAHPNQTRETVAWVCDTGGLDPAEVGDIELGEMLDLAAECLQPDYWVD